MLQCRNCDEWGHSGRECPHPKDWSRVECSNCHEKGHGVKRCTKPVEEVVDGDENGTDGDWGEGNNAAVSGGDGGW